MVANKMTGEKEVLFTAAYVTKFEEMEKQLSAPSHSNCMLYKIEMDNGPVALLFNLIFNSCVTD